MSLTPAQFRDAIAYVADAVAARADHLNALDSAIGDGDHGITMRKGMLAIKERLSKLPADADLEQMLRGAGIAFMTSTGGAIGVLMAKMLMAAGEALKRADLFGSEELRLSLSAMEIALATSGKARPGDKTILDAVNGATEALRRTDHSIELPELLSIAAEGAEGGARGTVDMLCRIGRASRLGERARGHADPGAVSFALMLRALSHWVQGAGKSHAYPETVVQVP